MDSCAPQHNANLKDSARNAVWRLIVEPNAIAGRREYPNQTIESSLQKADAQQSTINNFQLAKRLRFLQVHTHSGPVCRRSAHSGQLDYLRPTNS